MNSIRGNGNIMGQAFSAMMSGQRPQEFLSNLAKTNPRLQGLDMNNLQQTAQNLCNQRGVNMNDMMNKIKSGMMK